MDIENRANRSPTSFYPAMGGEGDTVKRPLRRHSKRLHLHNRDHQTCNDEDTLSSRGGDGNGAGSGSGLPRSKRLKYGSGFEDSQKLKNSQELRQSLQHHSHRESDSCGDNERGADQPAGGVSILDALNMDCWRLVFEYIPINDIVRSERVSRAWQRLVLDYLPGVKLEYRDLDLIPCISYHKKNNRIILCPKSASLIKGMIRKLAPFFVTLESRCINADGLIFMALHCPKLETLMNYSGASGTPRVAPRAPAANASVVYCVRGRQGTLRGSETGVVTVTTQQVMN